MELSGDFSGRLALQEELKSLPFGAVWIPAASETAFPKASPWLDEIRRYETEVLSRR